MDRPYIVVACDDGDVRIYDDMSDIGRDLESIDIRAGNYRCGAPGSLDTGLQ